ncbi:helix-turn-helix transcriptional regulator [Streptomyces durbertensis]|uniref:Helix-turn-helix transcriptional regulator n=1 Tax=Streptomyces durbertensis TaxID=2448886 RepID=A0ABR6EAJ6_9ACTN|nr:PadR family transcriptional regulator [Streptomyces durbertensis]MBB1242346.1 helix-turn-helix transcriptional regulator [Streptomyces durbertensis]
MTPRVMQEPTLLLLTALADQPRHGYAITQEIRKISDGQVTMRTGTLYGALERLLKQGLIEVHREEVVDGRLRRLYALSDEGRERLAGEAERLAATAREASRRLGVFGSGAAGSPRPSAATS